MVVWRNLRGGTRTVVAGMESCLRGILAKRMVEAMTSLIAREWRSSKRSVMEGEVLLADYQSSRDQKEMEMEMEMMIIELSRGSRRVATIDDHLPPISAAILFELPRILHCKLTSASLIPSSTHSSTPSLFSHPSRHLNGLSSVGGEPVKGPEDPERHQSSAGTQAQLCHSSQPRRRY